mmetsp:Transcript_20295/g.62743  ORF Transcript_20295/g.62743 Transcript_20295/m.62743 type:complete len:206 (-) Transcript_20295:862-1479(-)
MKKYGGQEQLIEYASYAVFAFVWGVEETYSKLLTTANLLAFSGDLVVKIHEALVAHEPALEPFRATIPCDALKDLDESRALVLALAGHLLVCYHRMRGRDFVKQVMSNLKCVQRLFLHWRVHRTGLCFRRRSATQNRNSHRDRLAAISTAASNAATKRAENNKKRRHEETTSGAVDGTSSLFDAEERAPEREEDGEGPSDLLPSL